MITPPLQSICCNDEEEERRNKIIVAHRHALAINIFLGNKQKHSDEENGRKENKKRKSMDQVFALLSNICQQL
jgi:hypothetical protein